MSLKTPTDNCLACGHKASTPKHTHKGYELVHCAACGLHWVEPKPSAEDLASYYSHTYNLAVNHERFDMQRMAIQDSQLLHERIQRFAPHAITVCEIGCATGELLSALSDRGYSVSGYELSSVTSEIARTKGLAVTAGPITAEGPKFDVIFMRHVLDHTRDPIEQISTIAKRLNRRGLAILAVPNGAGLGFRLLGEYWFWYIPPAHLWYFTAASLIYFFGKSSLKPVHQFTQKGDANNLFLELGLGAARWGRKLFRGAAGELIPARPEQMPTQGSIRRALQRSTDVLYSPFSPAVDRAGLGDELWMIGRLT